MYDDGIKRLTYWYKTTYPYTGNVQEDYKEWTVDILYTNEAWLHLQVHAGNSQSQVTPQYQSYTKRDVGHEL